MKSRTRIILITSISSAILLGGIAAIAAPAIYRDMIAAPADERPAAALERRDAPTLRTEDIAGVWKNTADSFAGYRLQEVLNGTEVTVTGRTTNVTAEVHTSQTEVTAALIGVDMASIQTDSGNRDNYFRSSVAETARFPTANFVLDSAIPLPPVSGDIAKISAQGTLSLVGVERPITATFSGVVDGNRVRLAGSIPLRFSDYGMTAPDLGFVTVEDTGEIEFLVTLDRVSE